MRSSAPPRASAELHACLGAAGALEAYLRDAAPSAPAIAEGLASARALCASASALELDLAALGEAVVTCVTALPQAPPVHGQLTREVLRNAIEHVRRVALGPVPRARSLAATQDERAALASALRAAAASMPQANGAPSSSAPAPSESPAQRASAITETWLTAPLVELFCAECELHAAALSTGLVALEDDATPDAFSERVNGLMRAAHSLKGAARVVGLSQVSNLAHALEDRMINWRDAGRASRADVDRALAAADLFSDAAKALADDPTAASGIERSAAQRAHALREEPIDKRPSVLSLVSVPPGPSAPSVAPPSSSLPPLAKRAGPEPIRSSPPARPGAFRTPTAERRMLRVASESFDRLTGLAGESLVESRRVGALAERALRVKRRQGRLSELVAQCEQRALPALDDATRALLRAVTAEVAALGAELTEHGESLERHVQRAESLGERMYREALHSRMRPFADGTRGLPRQVRDIARQLDKRVRFEIAGEDTKVDRDVLEGLDAPLNHLLRNALDHGIELPAERRAGGKPETALVRVEAHHNAGMLVVIVRDDGRGIDLEAVRARVVDRKLARADLIDSLTPGELLDFLFLPGFSTARSVSDISGRGVGLDVVKSTVEALGGSVRIESQAGYGTAFVLRLPVTRSVMRAVTARVGGEMYAFPLFRIDRIDRIDAERLLRVEGAPCFLLDGHPVSVVSARSLLGFPASAAATALSVVIVNDHSQRFAIVVDELCGEQDLVIRPLDARLGKVQDIAAAAVLEDGTPALVVDVDDLLRSVERASHGGLLTEPLALPAAATQRKRVLVVDDSITVREAERQMLAHRGYTVEVAVDGVDGLNALRRAHFDLVVTDIDMPRLNGFELIRSMRKDGKLAHLPVIIVSYKDREDDRKLGLEVGASYYLTKASFHDERLLDAVQELIGEAS